VDMRSSLYKQKFEPEYEIEKRNVNDFLSIANEIVSNVKIGNYEYIKNNQDMKKIMEQSRSEKEKKFIRKKLNINNSNNNKINNNNNININNVNENQNSEYGGGQWVSLNKENNPNLNAANTNNVNNINKKDHKLNTNNKRFYNEQDDSNCLKRNVSNIINRNFMSTVNEGNRINLNRISNLEAQPGKIKIKETINQIKDLINVKTEQMVTQGISTFKVFYSVKIFLD